MASPATYCPTADVIDETHDSQYNDDCVCKTRHSEDDFTAEPLVNYRRNEQRFGDKTSDLSCAANPLTNTPSRSISFHDKVLLYRRKADTSR